MNCEPGLQSCLVVGVGELARHVPLSVPVGDVQALEDKYKKIETTSAALAEDKTASETAGIIHLLY